MSPVFDYKCGKCEKVDEKFVYHDERQLCSCGGEMEKIWLPGRSRVAVIQDTIEGGRVVENLDSKPTRYDSRSAIKRRMDSLGVESKVQHVGEQGSDKSKHTSRWI